MALDRSVLDLIVRQKLTAQEAIASSKVEVQGSAELFALLFSLLDDYTGNFPVVDAACAPQ